VTPTDRDRSPSRAARALLGGVLLLAATAGVGAGAAPASAADPTDVFVGVVDQARANPGPGGERTATYDVTVLSVYLGGVRTEEVEVTSTPAFFSCPTRRVTAGQQYAFRVAEQGGELVADACGDVRSATASVRRALSRTYPDVRPPVATAPAFDDVEYTSADLGEPTEFTRAAAPGAALVIVGLLGLLVARRFARSRD